MKQLVRLGLPESAQQVAYGSTEFVYVVVVVGGGGGGGGGNIFYALGPRWPWLPNKAHW